VAALKRAGRRVAIHLMRAAVEGLRAVEAIVDELAKVGSESGEPNSSDDGRQRIEVE
jgi:hypothetical protein